MLDKKLIKLAVEDKKFYALVPQDIRTLLGDCGCTEQGKKHVSLAYERIAAEMWAELSAFKERLKKYRERGKAT